MFVLIKDIFNPVKDVVIAIFPFFVTWLPGDQHSLEDIYQFFFLYQDPDDGMGIEREAFSF